MLLPEWLRVAVLVVAVAIFAVAQARLIVLAARQAARPVASRLGPRADVLLLATSGALTALLLVACAYAIAGASP